MSVSISKVNVRKRESGYQLVRKTIKGREIAASGGYKARYGDFRKKKRGCKTTAPKNFNHIFIEKPEPKVRVFCIWAKAILVNAIF